MIKVIYRKIIVNEIKKNIKIKTSLVNPDFQDFVLYKDTPIYYTEDQIK